MDRPASLRRIDWRFLLPAEPERSFDHLLLLGGSHELCQQFLETGFARRVSTGLAEVRAPSIDVTVVLHGSGVDVSRVAPYLVPGAVLYAEFMYEWSSPKATGPAFIVRRLQAENLTPTGVYWVRPNFDRADAYIPLDMPEAERWFCRFASQPASPGRRAADMLFSTAAGIYAYSPALLTRRFALTAIAGAASNTLPSLLRNPGVPEELRKPELRSILLTSGNHFNRIIVLPFIPGSEQPQAVLKVGRIPEVNDRIEREQSVLADLHRALDASLRQTIPRPLGTTRAGQFVAGLETYIAGRPLSSRGGTLKRRIDDLFLVTDWLSQFNCQLQCEASAWGDQEIERWVTEPLMKYRLTFGTTDHEEQLFAHVKERASTLRGMDSRTVCVHWGFEQRNILRSGNRIAVVDWEDGSHGPPLLDLLHFVTYWTYASRHLHDETSQLRGFRQLFFECDQRDAALVAAREAIGRYMKRLAIDPKFLPLLLVMTWIHRALGRAQGHAAGKGDEKASHAGNIYVQYIYIMAEQAEQLFA